MPAARLLGRIGGSEHAWFEDRGPPCTLLGFIDDATSRLQQLRFVASELAFDYFRTTRAYLEEHGKPVAFYSDKHGIFRVNSKDVVDGEGVTQFGRALLHRHHLCQQPAGEGTHRTHRTHRTRLWHVAGPHGQRAAFGGRIVDGGGERLAAGVITAHNARFGRDPANKKDLHRPLGQADDLDEILAWPEERTVTRNLTLHYARMMLLLDPTPLARGLVRKKVVSLQDRNVTGRAK